MTWKFNGFKAKRNFHTILNFVPFQKYEMYENKYRTKICDFTVFFDLRKAFDKVWHRGLLAKLKACGVTGAALNWFKSYLSNRQQCVKVNQSISSPLQIHAGVPQGAILSPLLFIIYRNDISQAAPKGSSVNLFADDTSLYVNDTCPRQLANELQHAADCLSSWFTKWLLTVNPEKTAMMLIRRKRMAPLSFQIFVNGKPVPQVLTHKHLGLIIEHTHSRGLLKLSRFAQEQRRRSDYYAVSEIAFPIYQSNSCTRHRSGQSLSMPLQHGAASHKKTTSNSRESSVARLG